MTKIVFLSKNKWRFDFIPVFKGGYLNHHWGEKKSDVNYIEECDEMLAWVCKSLCDDVVDEAWLSDCDSLAEWARLVTASGRGGGGGLATVCCWFIGTISSRYCSISLARFSSICLHASGNMSLKRSFCKSTRSLTPVSSPLLLPAPLPPYPNPPIP